MKRKQIKIGVVIPVRNCLTYTVEAVDSIKTQYPYQLFVIDDRSDPPMKMWLEAKKDIVSFIDPPGSTGLAYNWNLGIDAAIRAKCTHILVANNDVLFHPQTIDNLVERMKKKDVVMVTGVNSAGRCPNPTDIFSIEVGEESETEHPDFSCFMITPETIDTIGWFDTNYRGAYFEDGDYHARIALLGHKAITINRAPYYHYASMTQRDNPTISDQIQERFRENQNYFIRKWGSLPLGDVEDMRARYYKHPFNDSNKTLKDF